MPGGKAPFRDTSGCIGQRSFFRAGRSAARGYEAEVGDEPMPLAVAASAIRPSTSAAVAR
ncbi:MAG: hypothetical protein JO309_11235 [Pseudonocardiales bacterium]|nr:hypothetical protein [Pseudonocardiales bacterium]MBV9729955.1 hypothetical protein [Pseudonocardiales bacterium]